MKNFGKDLRIIIDFLEKRNIPYYVNAGYALVLHGIKGETDDFDIRIYFKDIKGLFFELKKKLTGKFKLYYHRKYSRGFYDNFCITYSNLGKFDIYGKMVANCDLGKFVFPFKRESFKNAKIKKFGLFKLPVASLEELLLYYLVCRRYEKSKNDELHIREILSHKRFSSKMFKNLIKEHPKKEKIIKLLNERMNKL